MLKKNNIMRKLFVLLTALLLPLFAFEMNWEGYNMTILPGSAEYIGDSHYWVADGGRDDGWYAFNSNHYPYSRQNFFISKPN